MSPANRRTVPAAVGRRVRQRARHRCGYCLCNETLLGMPMEFGHLIPQAAGGTTREENLWLAPTINSMPRSRHAFQGGSSVGRSSRAGQGAAETLAVLDSVQAA